MRNWIRDNKLNIFIGIVIVFLVLGSVFQTHEDVRLRKQCMDDGKKEYECEVILRRPVTRVIERE